MSLTITGAGVPVLTPIPDSLDFGSHTVATASAPETSFITNTGAADPILGSPFTIIPTGGDFVLQSGSCVDEQTLAPGAQCLLNF